jgi:hypothetical protein
MVKPVVAQHQGQKGQGARQQTEDLPTSVPHLHLQLLRQHIQVYFSVDHTMHPAEQTPSSWLPAFAG